MRDVSWLPEVRDSIGRWKAIFEWSVKSMIMSRQKAPRWLIIRVWWILSGRRSPRVQIRKSIQKWDVHPLIALIYRILRWIFGSDRHRKPWIGWISIGFRQWESRFCNLQQKFASYPWYPRIRTSQKDPDRSSKQFRCFLIVGMRSAFHQREILNYILGSESNQIKHSSRGFRIETWTILV